MKKPPRLLAALVFVFAATIPVLARQAKTPPATIGDYSIEPYGRIKTLGKPGGGYDITLTGQNGRAMLAKSPRYDISAPYMKVLLTPVTVGVGKQATRKLKVTGFVTTGSTKVVARNSAAKQQTVITCREIRFSATEAQDDRGVMRLIGNVRTETTDAATAAPFVITGDTGTAKFLEDGTLDITLDATGDNGTLSGQFYEPSPKPKKPTPKDANP